MYVGTPGFEEEENLEKCILVPTYVYLTTYSIVEKQAIHKKSRNK